MAGNKTVFQESLRKAHNYAWDRKWLQAAAEYRRALAEFDSDPMVWVSLGVALLEAKRIAEAKDAYRRASDLRPDDIALQQKLAELYERLGDVENALQMNLQVATALQKSDAPAKAVDAWRAILRLQPAHLDSRQRLAELLAQLGRKGEAAQEYITLARLLREPERIEEAAERVRKALALDPRNVEARQFMDSLQLTVAEPSRVAPPPPPQVSLSAEDSPMHDTAQQAMARLADSIFERGQSGEASAYITQAIDLQTRGKTHEAIEAYQRAQANGASLPEIHFNLGVLYLSAMRLEEAAQEFLQTVQLPAYALGSHFALGQCYRMRGSMGEAIEHLLEAIKLVDLETVRPEQSDQLLQIYNSLCESYTLYRDGDATVNFANALLEFMSSKQWQARSQEFRRRLNALSEDGQLLPIAELLTTQDPDEVLSALTLSREYLARQKYMAAIDECYHAIALAPNYLPLHARMAQVYVEQGRTELAVAKYQMMAAVQRVRGDALQAIETYRQILKLSPQDVDTRARLIELLSEQGAIGEVIEQRIALGEGYYELAQLDRALSEYQEALRLIPRVERDRWSQTILHQMGEIYVQRAAWKEALAIYLQLRKMAPNDEKASLRLIDLYFKLGRDPELENELNHLIENYEQSGAVAQLIPVVSDMVALRPKSTALRQHLIDVLLMAGRTDQAVGELDALGELQLTAGRPQEAMQTIERIIALKPDNIESYRALLAQLQAEAGR